MLNNGKVNSTCLEASISMICFAQNLHGTVIHPFLKMVVSGLECLIAAPFVVSVRQLIVLQSYLTSQIRADAHAQYANTPRQMKENNSVYTNQTSW